jgi:hypothetical protein
VGGDGLADPITPTSCCSSSTFTLSLRKRPGGGAGGGAAGGAAADVLGLSHVIWFWLRYDVAEVLGCEAETDEAPSEPDLAHPEAPRPRTGRSDEVNEREPHFLGISQGV